MLYGVNRLTWDVDLAVELTAENLGSLETILKRIGFSRRIPAPMIPVDLLAQMKREAGRPEDLLGLKALRELGRI